METPSNFVCWLIRYDRAILVELLPLLTFAIISVLKWKTEGVNSGWFKTDYYTVHAAWNDHQQNSLPPSRRHNKSTGTLEHHIMVFCPSPSPTPFTLRSHSSRILMMIMSNNTRNNIAGQIPTPFTLLNNNKQFIIFLLLSFVGDKRIRWNPVTNAGQTRDIVGLLACLGYGGNSEGPGDI